MAEGSVIGLGLAAIGRPQYINIQQQQKAPFDYNQFYKAGLQFIDEAYNKGIRYFDTAPGYGIAEQLVIDWLAGRPTAEPTIATKWGYTYTANFDPNADQHEVKEHSLEKLNEQWQQSKHLLPHLNAYQIHSATFDSGVLNNQQVLERLFELKKTHQIEIGLTSTGDNQVDILSSALEVEVDGEELFTVFQFTFNVFDQSVLPVAQQIVDQGKRAVIKEALANGRIFPNGDYPHYEPIYQALQTLASKYRAGIDAIGLRFCMQALSPSVVLCGAATLEHLTSNLKALDFQLSEEEMAHLTSVKQPPKGYWLERQRLSWK